MLKLTYNKLGLPDAYIPMHFEPATRVFINFDEMSLGVHSVKTPRYVPNDEFHDCGRR